MYIIFALPLLLRLKSIDSQCYHIRSFNVGNISNLEFVSTLTVYNRKNQSQIPDACWDSWVVLEVSAAWQQMTQYVESYICNYEGRKRDRKVQLLLLW